MFLGYHLGRGLQSRGLLVCDYMNLPRNWYLFWEHRCHALLGFFSLNHWWGHLCHVCSKTLGYRTLLGNCWNFNRRILISTRYLILRLCFHCLSRLRILNRLDVSDNFRKLSSFTSIFGHPHGPLVDHGRRRIILRVLLFISDFLPLSLDFLSLRHHLPSLSILSLLHIPHQLGKRFSFLLKLKHSVLQ